MHDSTATLDAQLRLMQAGPVTFAAKNPADKSFCKETNVPLVHHRSAH